MTRKNAALEPILSRLDTQREWKGLSRTLRDPAHRQQDLNRVKKAPRTVKSRTPRQPSPRTAKPQLDIRSPLIPCKRHFGNPVLCRRRTLARHASVKRLRP